jgi:hypothetical protein
VDDPERAGHRLERLRHRRVLRWLSLQLGERRLKMRQRRLRGLRDRRSRRALELVQRTHCLSDRRRQLEELLRHVGIPLKGVQPSGKRLSCIARKRDDVGHGTSLLAFQTRRPERRGASSSML